MFPVFCNANLVTRWKGRLCNLKIKHHGFSFVWGMSTVHWHIPSVRERIHSRPGHTASVVSSLTTLSVKLSPLTPVQIDRVTYQYCIVLSSWKDYRNFARLWSDLTIRKAPTLRGQVIEYARKISEGIAYIQKLTGIFVIEIFFHYWLYRLIFKSCGLFLRDLFSRNSELTLNMRLTIFLW